MLVANRPLSSIRPYPGNPRRIPDAAVAAVARSIEEFGFRVPIVVDAEGVVIAGHVRMLAAARLGLVDVPVHVAADLEPDKARAYRLADNATADLSDWDENLLPIELEALKAAGVELDSLGFDDDDLADLLAPDPRTGLTDPDAVPAPPPQATTRPGDLWILGDHRLLCGDSTSRTDLDRLLGGETVQLVNTDPPYNVNVEPRSNNAIAAGLSSHQATRGSRHPEKAKATGKTLRAKDRPLANDFVTEAEFDRLLDDWFGNIARVLEPGRAFYIWGGFGNCGNYPPVLRRHELHFAQAIIWVKEHPVLTRKDFMGNHEWCFYGWRQGAAHQFLGPANAPDVWSVRREGVREHGIGSGLRLEATDGCRLDVLPPAADRRLPTVRVGEDGCSIHGPGAATDVWTVKKVNPQSMVHLTEKPVELAARAMRYSSRPGERVLDLFGGSGSTLIAAEQQNRRAFLVELDALYCDVIVDRWQQFTGRAAHLEGGESWNDVRRARLGA